VHVGSITREQGELVYPINSLGFFGLRVFRKMINQVTMNNSMGYDNFPAVSYYVMGAVDEKGAPGNEWQYADSWPVPVTNRSWYFHSDGGLITSVADEGVLTFLYDPSNPVPTVGGQNLNIWDGPYDQRMVEDRDDVLVFSSEVLDEPYEITGRVVARLFVSSDCVDTDFTVKLTDVYPDGRSMLITDGILRMRNRNGSDHWEFMNPGEIYDVKVEVGSTSYIWNTGHKIRVSVSSSNFPRFLNNPNTVDGIMQNESYVVANNVVFCNDMYPSSIIFPEI
jgi:putative CocE/NonD family hydrolase